MRSTLWTTARTLSATTMRRPLRSLRMIGKGQPVEATVMDGQANPTLPNCLRQPRRPVPADSGLTSVGTCRRGGRLPLQSTAVGSIWRSPNSALYRRRIPDKQNLIDEIAAWEHTHNAKHTKANWHFTTPK